MSPPGGYTWEIQIPRANPVRQGESPFSLALLDSSPRGGANGRLSYGEPETFRLCVGAGLVPARRKNLGDAEPPGESVPLLFS